MTDEFVDEIGPLEETGNCENCSDERAASDLRLTDDEVLLCPECWAACVEDEKLSIESDGYAYFLRNRKTGARINLGQEAILDPAIAEANGIDALHDWGIDWEFCCEAFAPSIEGKA